MLMCTSMSYAWMHDMLALPAKFQIFFFNVQCKWLAAKSNVIILIKYTTLGLVELFIM